MSQKLKHVVYSGVIMAIVPLVIKYLLFVPLLSYFALFEISTVFGPANMILESLRYTMNFQMSGDFPPILLFISSVIWLVVGAVFGLVLYKIQKKEIEPSFGLGSLFIVLISQSILGYILTYLSAIIFNILIFHKVGF